MLFGGVKRVNDLSTPDVNDVNHLHINTCNYPKVTQTAFQRFI